jgi:hypothetical protein
MAGPHFGILITNYFKNFLFWHIVLPNKKKVEKIQLGKKTPESFFPFSFILLALNVSKDTKLWKNCLGLPMAI